jgi:tripartite-type tricarboxylate transporter receptor subunit TctC
MLNRRTLLLSSALVAAGFARAGAQDYPARPIRIIVPLAAGGMADILARVIAAKLGEAGHTAVVENRTGGSGVIGADAVAKSPADGYTLLMGLHATQAILVHMTKLPYDPAKDFAPVIHVATVPNVLLVNNSVPANSLSELIAHAKANPGKLTFGTPGHGTSPHMAGELFKYLAGVDLTHVPYRGASAALTDLIAGRTDLSFAVMASGLPLAQNGQLRAIGVTTSTRAPMAPDVPTIAESGISGYDMSSWFAFVVPAKTPAPIVQKIQSDTVAVLKEPAIKERLDKLGVVIVGSTAAQLGDHLKSEMARWEPVIRRANIKVNE